MKRMLLAAVAALALAVPAAAADFPIKAPAGVAAEAVQYGPWTGVYLGVNGSYNWQFASMPNSGLAQLDANGAMGGVTVGADWQHGSLVFGLLGDADFGSAGITTTNGGTMMETWQQTSFSTVRGRIGYLVTPAILLYGTGGLAVATADEGEICPVTTNTFSQCATKKAYTGRGTALGPYNLSTGATFIGGVVGAGAEWMFLPHWSTKIEYLWADMGNQPFNLGSTPSGVATNPRSVSLVEQQVRLGVNYKFNTW